MDLFADGMTVDEMLRRGIKPQTNRSLERGIEFFDRSNLPYGEVAFSPVVTGYVQASRTPLETIRRTAMLWETEGVHGVRPFYLRKDFAPLGSDPDVLHLRSRLRREPREKTHQNRDFGHEMSYKVDPLDPSTDFRQLVPDEMAGNRCPTLHLTTLVVVNSEEIIMTINSLIGPMDDVRVNATPFILIPTMRIMRKEIEWSFLGSVWCWRVFKLVRFSSCTEQSQNMLRERSVGLVRHFAGMLQEGIDTFEPADSRRSKVLDGMAWINPGTRL